MKKILIYLTVAGSLMCTTSCSDWLNVLPNNERVTADFWKTKEDVEAVVASCYSGLRDLVPTLIDWSELRGSSIIAATNTNKQKLQNFQILPSDALCKWNNVYKVLNYANSVIKYAPGVREYDETYGEGAMNSHLCEAYFVRSLCYFYLVRNFRDVPLIIEPYVDDSAPFPVAKSTEKQILAQIKNDLKTAIDTGAAKEFFDEDDYWQGVSKGRATKWALYALMADVCLWDEDYDGCIEYADLLLNATATRRPAFMKDPTYSSYFSIFYPGNSNESIFELNWHYSEDAYTANNPASIFTASASAAYRYSQPMCERLYDESIENGTEAGTAQSLRAEWGAFGNADEEATDTKNYIIWKYQGIGFQEFNSVRSSIEPANFIVYRMADVMMMKAEALVRKGSSNYQEALSLVNEIRRRAGLNLVYSSNADFSEQDMLEIILKERDIEFAGEGKRWYDLLRFGKSQNFKYKEVFVNEILNNNQTANTSWLRSVLNKEDAWYLPISQSEMDVNPLLVQNPYYGGTTTKK